MNSTDYSARLHAVIPGGAHTYSRGDDQYPANAPAILASGKGCYVYDADGNEYLDYGMALRAVTIGYGYKDVAEAAFAEILKGNNLTRASVTELTAAERLLELFPGMDMVKFGKNGSTVTSAAVKLARAYTGRAHVAFPEEQPFFSYDDWFIGSTAMDKGVPADGRPLSLKFKYNDIASLQRLFDAHPGQIACVIMEATTYIPPCTSDACKGNRTRTVCRTCPERGTTFLHDVKNLCHKNGAVFILDEMITGFRWHLNGAQYFFDIEPDLATFGKGMANGFAVAALTGKREIMEQGGITKNGQERVFLISTTHGAEMCGLGALVKTIELYKQLGVTDHLWAYGAKFIDQMNALAAECGIGEYFSAEGYPCSPYYFTRDAHGKASLEFRTLFAQEMMKHRILLPWIALAHAHGDAELSRTLEAARSAFRVYAQALESGVEKFLVGSAVKPVFRKHN
jgi:glutamate-1-semialdehyde 2,1-aminomutase